MVVDDCSQFGHFVEDTDGSVGDSKGEEILESLSEIPGSGVRYLDF